MAQLKASDIIVLKVEKKDHPRIKALATIHIDGVGTLSGLKVVKGTQRTYCTPPNQCYVENGLRVWMNLITFEKYIWDVIQGKILDEYELMKENEDDRDFNRLGR